MRICPATLETSDYLLKDMKEDELPYGLVSYYYLGSNKQKTFDEIISKIKGTLLIDSGAHSFQHGKKVDLVEFTKGYAEFIKRNTNNPKVEGFFEMDVDVVIGYEKVLELRKILEEVSDKIIPVWHTNRGIKDYEEMCKKYSGRRIALGGFVGDIVDGQFNLFINTAHKYGCKVHILGLTRFDLIKDLNLGKDDSVDSSSWKQTAIFGGIDLPTTERGIHHISALEGLKLHYKDYVRACYLSIKEVQRRYLDLDQSDIS